MEKIKVNLLVRGNIYAKSLSCGILGNIICGVKDEYTLDLSEANIIEGDMDIRNCNVLAIGNIVCTGTAGAEPVCPSNWENLVNNGRIN